jgi:hypothetical protein
MSEVVDPVVNRHNNSLGKQLVGPENLCDLDELIVVVMAVEETVGRE